MTWAFAAARPAMKKCSRSVHHTLSEINITPLLDLAFVLLVIFIITTTPVVNDLNLNLPHAQRREKDPPRKANYISIDSAGEIHLNRRKVQGPELLETLIALRLEDPDLSVIVRGDAQVPYRRVRAVLDQCQQANVLKVELATEALDAR